MGQTKEQKILKQLSGPHVQQQATIATDMFIPNHSGISKKIQSKGAVLGGTEDIILYSGRKNILEEPHIRIYPLSSDGYSQIAFFPEQDFTKKEGEVLISVHKTLTGGADHKHLTIYTSKLDDSMTGRLNIPYGTDKITITTESSDIHFNNNETGTNLKITGSTGSAEEIQLGDQDSSNQGVIKYDNNGDYMSFRTNGSGEDMRITSNGKVGIANINPSEMLDVTGNINATAYKVGTVAGASGSFTTVDLKTVTVTNGIITSIV